MIEPSYQDEWTEVYVSDALSALRSLPEQSVHCCVTSPPFWSLRSYLPQDHPDKARELGSEATVEAYVENLMGVFGEVRRVLHDSGTLWLNLGDCFLPKKQLAGIPWRVAFALQADGWYLRSEITWCKKAPMPESVTDRPTSATEKVFLFAKKPRYFYDAEAVREKAVTYGDARHLRTDNTQEFGRNGSDSRKRTGHPTTSRNLRNYWLLGPSPYPESHYATFPPDLVYPCVKAGTSEYGVCQKCLSPWERVVEKEPFARPPEKLYGGTLGQNPTGKVPGSNTRGMPDRRPSTVGWQPTCSCHSNTVPATVLDPFCGSGTTLWAARKLGRKSVGIDLDERNLALVEKRMGCQGVLL